MPWFGFFIPLPHGFLVHRLHVEAVDVEDGVEDAGRGDDRIGDPEPEHGMPEVPHQFTVSQTRVFPLSFRIITVSFPSRPDEIRPYLVFLFGKPISFFSKRDALH